MYSYNPLIVTKLDRNKKDLNDLEDVNTAGTVGGNVLTYRSGTWIPETPAGGGDMLKAEYVTGAGTVYNASRLAGDVLATVQAHNVAAAKITEGTIDLARVPAIDDARIPNLETLSYGGTFATAQIPDLPTAKITTGTFGLARIPVVDDARIPDLESLSYGGAFATAQIPGVGAYKVTAGTLSVARHETLDNLNGTVALTQVPAMDDGHIPDVNGMSYGAAFAVAQIPNLGASKIATGTFNANRIPVLPTSQITTGTFNLNRIPAVDDARIPDLETLSYGAAFATAQIPAIGAYKVASGTLGADRIPALANLKGTVTDAKIPDVETLSYGAAFAVAQIPNLGASKITTGTFGLARIPSIDNAHLAGAITSDKISALSGTAVTYPLDADSVGTTAIKASGVGNAELAASGLDIAKFTVGTAGLARIPALPTTRITSGTLAVARHETLDNLNGTVALAQIPTMDDGHIPDVETLSYSLHELLTEVGNNILQESGSYLLSERAGTFAVAQIPYLAASKITAGTFNLNRIPTIDDAHIPDLAASKITTGSFNVDRIPSLPTSKITSGTFGLARIPGTLTGKDADTVDGADAGVAADSVFKIPSGIAQGDIFHVNSGGSVVNLSAGTSGHFLKTLGAGTNPAWASVPGGGDMLKNVYDTTDNSIVDNSERLENSTLATVQAHNVAASKVTSGTLGLAQIPAVDDARIPDLETLSYGSAFAGAQIPSLPTSKITSGTLSVARHETLDNLNGTVALAQIPSLPTTKITTGTFTTDRIPALPTTRITSGTLAVARHETLDNLNGTVALTQVPTMDDGHIPDVETLSYGGTFATAQIPDLAASKITTGTFNALRIPILPTDRYGSAVLLTGTQTIGGTKTFTVIPLLPASDPTVDNEAARKAYVDAQSGVKFHPYIGDETQLDTISDTYQDIKKFHFVKHGSVVSPSTMRVACELEATAGSYQMQVIVGGATAITFSGTQSTYTLRYDDYGLGAAATGVVETRAKLRNIGAGTAFNRLYDIYLKY